MTELSLMILLMGGTVVAFAFFGTYMAAKQKRDESKAQKS
jgi:uncharacterized protein YneF (UPF0154 family)